MVDAHSKRGIVGAQLTEVYILPKHSFSYMWGLLFIHLSDMT